MIPKKEISSLMTIKKRIRENKEKEVRISCVFSGNGGYNKHMHIF